MKRYFLGLALALLAIPGVSRGEVVTVLSRTGGTESWITDVSNARSISFTNTSSPSNNLNSIILKIRNTSGSSGTLKFDFNLDGLQSSNFLQNFSAAEYQDLSFDLNQSVASGAARTLNISFNAITGATSSQVFFTTTDAGFSETPWTAGSSDPINFQLQATVPEPTTMLLTGSVLAAGFGASVLRRFRKKSEEQTAV